MAESRPRVVFVTGKLASDDLTRTLDGLKDRLTFEPIVHEAKISVAALITPDWLVGKMILPERTERVILPGLANGSTDRLASNLNVIVERGPADLRDLPEFLLKEKPAPVDLSAHRIEILAEINHANRLPIESIMAEAQRFRADGADIIDLGATPGERWDQVGPSVRELVKAGFRVSIDSFDREEVTSAIQNGATLILSVNSSNLDWAKFAGAEAVVIPDLPISPDWLCQIEATVNELEKHRVPFRIDPVLEPIGFGFAQSLGRFLRAREVFPSSKMMMGIGNLTELTAVDSAGVNALLIGFCEETNITSVLTTEVINWCRSSVREVAAARSTMHLAVRERRLPKRYDNRLIMLRDPKLKPNDLEFLKSLQKRVKDPNFRLFSLDTGEIVAFNAERFEVDSDAFELFDRLGVTDPDHAFYLGWELMKATLANQLGKNYIQDRALEFGMLTREEISHRGREAGP